MSKNAGIIINNALRGFGPLVVGQAPAHTGTWDSRSKGRCLIQKKRMSVPFSHGGIVR